MRFPCQLEGKSPVKGDLHAGICGSRGVRFPSATRLPVGTSGPALLQIAEAKTICRSCRNTTRCLNWALEMGEDEGIWGGTTADERRALRLRRNRAGRVRR